MNYKNSEKFLSLMKELEKRITDKSLIKGDKEKCYQESKILRLSLNNPEYGLQELSSILSKELGTIINETEIENCLQNTYPRLGTLKDRKKVFPYIMTAVEAFESALAKGTPEAYEEYFQARNNFSAKWFSKSIPKLICLGILNRVAELDKNDGGRLLEGFSNTVAKHALYDISDVLAKYCQAEKRTRKGTKEKENTYQQKLQEMEEILERNRRMLQDIQEEFNEQLQETKIQELTAFFSKLNSDKYGSILDSLLQVRKGIGKLKREGFALPPEISGLFILIQKLTQFVMDNHINPIMKPEAILEMTALEAEQCEYIGSPFADKFEKKKVRVISPGWIYMDRDIRIARPKIKEEIEDE